MDIIEITRQLGAAIQQDERYLAFHEARKTNEADSTRLPRTTQTRRSSPHMTRSSQRFIRLLWLTTICRSMRLHVRRLTR